MKLNQLKRKYLAEGFKLGYKKFLKEMAFSPSFDRANYYSDLENNYDNDLKNYDAEYNKERERLMKKFEKRRQKRMNNYTTDVNTSKVLEKIADVIPVEVSNIKIKELGKGWLIIDDENCPIESIYIKIEGEKIGFSFFDYKDDLYIPGKNNKIKIKPEYKKMVKTLYQYKSSMYGFEDEMMPLNRAIEEISEVLRNAKSIYSTSKQ